MKLSKLGWLTLVIAVVLFMQLLIPFVPKNKVAAASANVQYLGTVSYGGSIVGDFRINGVQAFCIEHFKPTPPTNSPNYGLSPYQNKKIEAALYWGWGGEKNIFGKDRERGTVVTSLVLSRLYTGVDAGGKNIPGYSTLWEKAQAEDIPNVKVNFKKTSLNSSIKGNVQQTETNTFIADPSNKVSISLPSEVTLHKTTGESKKGGTVILKGGDSFYLTAPLTYNKDFNTGNLKGSKKEVLPIIVKMKNSSLQTLSFGEVRDPLETASFTAHFEAREKTITVLHKDNRDGTLLRKDSEKKIIGTSYSYAPRNDLKKGDYTYRPISNVVQKGTLGNKDITLTFYYDVPFIKTGLKKVEIYTAPANEGLPIKIDLLKTNIYPNSTPGMVDAKINLNIYKGSQLVLSKPYNAQNLPTHVDLTIPKTVLNVNQKNDYTVKLEGYNKNDIDVVTENQEIKLDGYTSSEQTIKVDSDTSTELNYKGVVKTEREAKKEMKTYYETIQIPVNKLTKMRTGYGFEMPLDINYKNEIGVKLNSLAFSMIVPEKIVDKSYIEYPTKDEKATVLMENTKQDNKNEGNTAVSIQKWELPHVNIEKITGHLFSDEQVADKDSRITKELLDGDRKFYLPIWGYIGDYPIKVESNEGIGVNKINIEVSHNLNVFAHMYGHIDSNTEKQDAIYLRPINSDKPNYPKSWTKEEIKRFEEWNNK